MSCQKSNKFTRQSKSFYETSFSSFLQKTICSSICSPRDDEWSSLKRAECFSKTPTLFASNSKNSLTFSINTFNRMRSLRKWITVLVMSQWNRAKLLHFSRTNHRIFNGNFFENMFVFPPETSTANEDSLFDNHAGSFLRKIWEDILKSRFSKETYFTENLIWTLRRMFWQSRPKLFSKIPKMFCAKSENPIKIIYCFKKSIFSWKVLWRKELQFSRTCRLILPKNWRNFCLSFSPKKLFLFKILPWTHGMQSWQLHQKICRESEPFSFTTRNSHRGNYCFKKIGFPQKR